MNSSDWALAANIATTLGVAVAIIIAIATQRSGTKQAAAAASRTEAAAALAEQYAQKLVDALQLLAQRTGQPTARQGVRWSLRNFENDRYILENVGDEKAEGVQVTAHESLFLESPPVQDLAPGESVTFMAAPSMGTSDSTVTVAWTDGSEQRSWRYPLPPRPRRFPSS